MSWESDRTFELGPVRPATPGRHRRGSRGRIAGILVAGALLVMAVSGAMLSPVLSGWPPPPSGTATSLPSTIDASGPGTPAALSPTPAAPTPARATPRPTASARPTGPSGIASLESQVFDLTNAERARARCPALRLDTRLRTAARGYSDEMARFGAWNHTGHDGSDPGERMRRAGYDTSGGWAENIARGYPSAEAVMQGWMNSAGHRANILNCRLKAIGVGVVRGSNGRLYWTQDFGAR